MKPIIIVQGGQYGSEAKGAVAEMLCREEKVDYAVRTGSVNAGHTVQYKGETYKFQQLPVGWTNPSTVLVIGAGSIVNLSILESEIEAVRRATGQDLGNRLHVDPRAGVHTAAHTGRSTDSGRHHAIGATGKGCSEALVDRIRGRGEGYLPIGWRLKGANYHFYLTDTERLLNRAVDEGHKVLLEGTQGTGLDLALGPYPYVTHKQCGPAQWMMEAGLSPSLPTDIVMVVRTFPIRVAGNSGPLPQEISWPELAREINARRARHGHPELIPAYALDEFRCALDAAGEGQELGLLDIPNLAVPEGHSPHDQHLWPDRDKYAAVLSELNATALNLLPLEVRGQLFRLFERTTVTNKLRRVARMDLPSLAAFARQVRPSRVVVTFMNYLFPENWGRVPEEWTEEYESVVQQVEDACRAPIGWVNWGPGPEHWQQIFGGGTHGL